MAKLTGCVAGRSTPPPLPSRLAPLLVSFCDCHCQSAALAAWREAEERFIAWVEAQPRPAARWRRKAERLRALHRAENRV